MHLCIHDTLIKYVTRPAKINHVAKCKKSPIFPSFHYHNLWTIHTNKIKSLSLLQNLMGFWNLWKWDTTFRAKDISKNITRCNLCSHGWFLQAWSHIVTLILLAGHGKGSCTVQWGTVKIEHRYTPVCGY